MNNKYKAAVGPTFNVDIYIAGDISTITEMCREWTMGCGGCVNITPINYIFTGGMESGAKIGFINYQRFPSKPEDITNRAVDLAQYLIGGCCQLSASVVTSTETFYIYNDKKEEE